MLARQLVPFTMRTAITPIQMTDEKEKQKIASRKISTKLLCDVSGTRYYESNEEIDFHGSQQVQVYDENNVNIGSMTFSEGYNLAASLGKDIVLRNAKTDPPVCKIMDYKVELIKRVFKKLGRDIKGDSKPKTIQMSSDINIHDLEFRKRRAIDFLKQSSKLKLFMRVNIYDPENIQKGRLILLNFAEDLKEYASIKVHPGGARAMEKAKSQEIDPETGMKKHMSANDMEMLAEQKFVKMNRAVIQADEGDEDFELDDDETKQYIYMELESKNSGLAQIDIDAMFNAASVSEFMHGISKRGTFDRAKEGQPTQKKTVTEDAMDMISSIMSGQKVGFDEDTERRKAPGLDFEGLYEQQDFSKVENDELLRN